MLWILTGFNSTSERVRNTQVELKWLKLTLLPREKLPFGKDMPLERKKNQTKKYKKPQRIKKSCVYKLDLQ